MDLVADIKGRIEWVEGDVLDVPFLEDVLEGMDWVFHCAAVISFNPKHVPKMMDVNVTGTGNIVNICLHRRVKKLIHASSIAAIGRPENSYHITETTKWGPSKINSQYAISKFKAEMEVWRGFAEGLWVGIVNPSVILGRGYWDKGSCQLFSRVRDGLAYRPMGATGFVDVLDVVRAMLRVAETAPNGERYVINGTNASYKDFFDAVAKELQVPPPSKDATPFLRGLAWRLEKWRCKLTGKSPLITKETALLSSLSYTYSNEKSVNELGLEYHPLGETIHYTCKGMPTKG
jgi:nucleoside-diphosphate-sugar epimerase